MGIKKHGLTIENATAEKEIPAEAINNTSKFIHTGLKKII